MSELPKQIVNKPNLAEAVSALESWLRAVHENSGAYHFWTVAASLHYDPEYGCVFTLRQTVRGGGPDEPSQWEIKG